MKITHEVEGLDRILRGLSDLERRHTPFALGRMSDAYQNRSTRVTIRSKGRTPRPGTYFSLPSRRGVLVAGVYKTSPAMRRKEEDRVLPVMIYIKSPQYRKRFRFYEVARAAAEREFQRRFFQALADATGGKFGRR
jgi:hypothetical protein